MLPASELCYGKIKAKRDSCQHIKLSGCSVCFCAHAPLPPSPPPPFTLTTAGHFSAVVSPRGGALANFVRPRDRAFENPGATPDLLALTCRWRFFKGMFSRFYACISPVLIEPEVGSRIDVNQHIFFGYIWNEISIGLGFK